MIDSSRIYSARVFFVTGQIDMSALEFIESIE